ncbi:MAG: S9 family peptidase [Marinifilaceae bacterium]|nr:S9 family peptidase [Marinifilaceae bacterium]
MKHFLLVIICLLSIKTLQSQQLEYPTCPKQTVVDTFFNQYPVSENYRWMEDIRSPEVQQWIKDENKISQKFLQKAAARYNSKASLKKYSYVDGSHAVKKGDYYFSLGRNKSAVAGLYMGNSSDNINQLIVDPNFGNGKDKIDITNYSVSGDSKYLAYMINRNGTDWREIKVISLPSGSENKDHLIGVKFSSISWKGDGFFYSRFPNQGEFYATLGEEIYFHKLGEDQSNDKLIFKRKNPSINFNHQTTENERFFVLEEKTGTHFNYFFIDYQTENPYLRPLLMKQKSRLSIIDNQENELIAATGKDVNGGAIVAIDPYKPYQWRLIVPEVKNAVLLNCIPKKDRILLIYQSNQHPILKIFSYSGKPLYSLEFPEASSVHGFYGKKEDEDLLFYVQQYTIPSLSYHFNTKTFERKKGEAVNVIFAFKNYENKPVLYPINDSISIPMNLVYKKGLKLNGNNPCLLEAYGGFGIISTPSFDPGIIYFIEKGGVYAYANIRGGGDLGKAWAQAGKRLNKQNTINDFNTAAEYLIKEGYSSANKMACTGGSHGGLVVAAAAIQRPDLYAAVVPVVAVTDMLRFEQFTVGVLHKDEFGTVADSTDFLNLRSYSPLHNIKEDVNYPAMLVMTSENDDRVPPLHSYKFVAQLQNRKAQTNPILLRVEKDAGHYGALDYTSQIQEKTNMYDFIMEILMK